MTHALIYHDLSAGESRRPAGPRDRYTIALEAFRHHLRTFAAMRLDVGLMRPGIACPGVAITFDDGAASALQAAEELEERGWRGHFFVTTDLIGRRGFLDRAGVVELAARGHDVGSHSHTHPTYMGRLSVADLEREWRTSREILGDLLGTPPLTASVPGGYLSRSVVATASAAGFRLLMTSEPNSSRATRYGMLVSGRYTIRAGTSADQAARYASGERRDRARMWVAWQAKQYAKRLSPAAFEAARHSAGRRRTGPD